MLRSGETIYPGALPRDSARSISPLAGQGPYTLSWGNILSSWLIMIRCDMLGFGALAYQIAGHNQSPFGSFATTSTLPYLIVFLPCVVILADRTGGMVVPNELLLLIEQAVWSVLVHVPAVVRFKVYPLYNSAVVILAVSFVKVGMIWSPSEVTKELAGSSVTHSNEPVLLHHQLPWTWAWAGVNSLPATVDEHFMIPYWRIDGFELFVQDKAVLQGWN